jgi:hypothetical protein
MSCGSCGGRKAATSEYLVTLDGEESRHADMATARMFIARNGTGKRATVKAVPKLKKT